MKRMYYILLLLLSGCQSMSATSPKLMAPELMPQELISPAGHRVFFQHMPEASDLAIVVDWPNNWSKRADKNQAVVPIGTNLLLVGGTEKEDVAETANKFSQWGVKGSLFPGIAKIRGLIRVKEEHLLDTAKLANQVLINPKYDKRWLARISADRRAKKLEADTRSAVLADQTMGYAVLQDEVQRQYILLDDADQYTSVAQSDLFQWHRDTFTSSDLNIAVAGKVEPDAALAAVDQLMAGLPKSTMVAPPPVRVDFKSQVIVLQKLDAEKATLAMVAPLPPLVDYGVADKTAAKILRSRLQKAIRGVLRASYGFNSLVFAYDRGSRFLILAGEVEVKKLKEAQAAAKEAYSKFITVGPCEKEVSDIKTQKLNNVIKNRQKTPKNVANDLLANHELGFPIDGPDHLMNEIKNLDASSLKTHLQEKWPKVDQFITIAVAAEKDVLDDACVIHKPSEVQACK